ncbi:MAG: hypothetical protein ACE366_04075 [Bradymonadia bacterium]
MRLRCWLSGLVHGSTLLAGCTVETQTLSDPISLPVRISDPDTVPREAPLRVAVAWRLITGLYIVSDEAITLEPEGDTLMSLQVKPLSPELASLLLPLNALTLIEDETIRAAALAHRVWIIAYEDVDGDGRFGPPTINPTPGADRVLAVDARNGPGLAYTPDLDALLDLVGLEVTERFYEQYGPRYNGFFRVTDDGSETRMAVAPEPTPPVALTLAANPGLTEAVACRTRSIPFIRGFTDRTIIFDPEVVPLSGGANPCAGVPEPDGAERTLCQVAILDEIEPPEVEELPPAQRTRRLECETDGIFSLLRVREGITTCSGCTCIVDVELKEYVVPRAIRPRWWPCGAETAPECSGGVITPWLDVCE